MSTTFRMVLTFWATLLAFAVGTVLFGPLSLLVTPFALMLMWEAAATVRRRRRAILLGYVEQAVRLNHPLPDVLDVAAISEGGKLGRRLRDLSLAVGHGEPIGEAMERTVPEMGQHAACLLVTAERTGQLGKTIRRIIEHDRLETGAGRAGVWFEWIYPLMLAWMTLLVLIVFNAVIIPKFEQIYADFGIMAPAVTQAMFDVARWMGDGEMAGGLAFGALAVWFGVACVATGAAFLPMRRGPVNRMLNSVTDLLWYVPFVRGLLIARGLTDVCYSASLSLRAGAPLHIALADASELRMCSPLRWRVLNWADRVESGEPVGDAARRAGMPALTVGMLNTAQATASAADVFAFLTRYYDARFSRAVMLARSAFIPVATVAVGLLVAWVAVAVLLPMRAMIEAVINTSGMA